MIIGGLALIIISTMKQPITPFPRVSIQLSTLSRTTLMKVRRWMDQVNYGSILQMERFNLNRMSKLLIKQRRMHSF